MEAQKLAIIMKNLNDPDGQNRRKAIEGLHVDDIDDTLLRMLVQKLEDENKGVRDAAFQFLKNVKNPMFPKLLVPFFFYRDLEVKNLAVDLMLGFGVDATPQLIEILNSTDPDAQKSSAEVITWLKAHQAIDALLGHLDDPDPNVSFACIEALGAIGDLKAVQPLIDLFKNSDELREVSIESLGKILSRRVPDDLINALYDDDPMIVFSVVDALGKIGDPKALDILLDIFPTADELIQGEILKAVGKIIKSSKYFLLPDMLLEAVKNSFVEEDREGKKDILPILAKLNTPDVLQLLLEAYNEFEDEEWQENVFSALVSYLTLFPEKGINYLTTVDDEELQVWFISHFPPTHQVLLFDYLVQVLAQNEEKEQLKQAAIYYAVQFDIKNAEKYVKKILAQGGREEQYLVLSALQNRNIEHFVDELLELLAQGDVEVAELVVELLSKLENKESIQAVISKVPFGVKIRLLKLLPDKVSEYKKELSDVLKDKDNENVSAVLDIVDIAPDEFTPEDILPLLEASDELMTKTVELLGKHWIDSYAEAMLQNVEDGRLLNAFLTMALEKHYYCKSEVLTAVNEKADASSMPLLWQLMIFSANPDLDKILTEEMSKLNDEEIEYYIEVALSHDRENFIKELLSNLQGHEQLKTKYSSFLESGD